MTHIVKMTPLIIKLPEFSRQADSGEGGFGLRHRFRTPIGIQSVRVPFLSQSPSLTQRQRSSAWTVPLRAPAIDMLFRPEQEHGPSGEDDVVVPMPRRHGNVDHSLRREQPAFLHPENHLVIAAAAGSVNARVLVQHCRNSQGIPDAVAIPGPLAGSNRKGGGHGREWSGAPEFSILLQDESVGSR